jgi:hypothetical protein
MNCNAEKKLQLQNINELLQLPVSFNSKKTLPVKTDIHLYSRLEHSNVQVIINES